MITKTFIRKIGLLVVGVFVINTLLATKAVFNPSDTTYIDLQICESDCPLPNGLPCVDGVFFQTLAGSDDCDSVLITTLSIVNQLIYTNAICEGDSIYVNELDSVFFPPFEGTFGFEWNGCPEGIVHEVNIDPKEIFFDFITTCSPGGCISILGLDTIVCPDSSTVYFFPQGNCGGGFELTVEVYGPTPIDSFVFNSCPENCLEWEGEIYCDDFSSTTIIPTSNVCDSIVYFEVNFAPESQDPIRLAYCEGECVTWDSVEYCEPFSQFEVLTSVYGCDSIVEFSVEEISFTPNLLPEDTMIQLGDQLEFEVDLDNFSTFWNTGVDGRIFIFEADEFGEGLHPVFATIVNIQTGCLRFTDTTMVQVGEISQVNSPLNHEGFKIYPNPTSQGEQLVLEITGGLENEKIEIFYIDKLGSVIAQEDFTSSFDKIILEKQGKLFPGVYFVEIIIGTFSTIKKIVIL